MSIEEFGKLRKNDINHPNLKDKVNKLRTQQRHLTSETPVYKSLPRRENKQFTVFKYPVIKTYDIGYIVDSDDMAPVIHPGNLVLATESASVMVYGAPYIICCADMTLIRVIKTHPEDEKKILLVSKNAEYEPIEIEKSIILELYIIKQVIKMQGV